MSCFVLINSVLLNLLCVWAICQIYIYACVGNMSYLYLCMRGQYVIFIFMHAWAIRHIYINACVGNTSYLYLCMHGQYVIFILMHAWTIRHIYIYARVDNTSYLYLYMRGQYVIFIFIHALRVSSAMVFKNIFVILYCSLRRDVRGTFANSIILSHHPPYHRNDHSCIKKIKNKQITKF